MKKLVAVLAALVCVFGLSVSSFAYNVVSPSSIPILRDDGDHYSFNFTVPASTFSSEESAIWNEFTDAFSGKSSNIAAVTYSTGAYGQFVYFWVIDGSFSFDNQNIVTSSGSRHCCLGLNLANLQTSLRIDWSTGKANFLGNGFVYTVISGFSKLVNNSSSPIYASTKYVDYDGKPLAITDDLHSTEPEEPEEPEEPSSSSEPDESIPDTPTPPSYTPTPPTIPEGNQYVPYDTSVWTTFLDRMRTNMGNATNIGFLIFAVYAAWNIMTRIIKRFTNVG